MKQPIIQMEQLLCFLFLLSRVHHGRLLSFALSFGMWFHSGDNLN